jgi:hypothetical protein
MPGLSKVIVLDPDARASRLVQLGFEREGIPAVAVATDAVQLDLPGEDTGLVVVGGNDDQGTELVRRARGWLYDHRLDVPIVFAGRGVPWAEATAAGADEVLRQPAYLRDVVTIGRLFRGLPSDRRDHLVGNLIDVTGVFTLVRALSALGRSATLTLVRGLRRGEVRFFHGEVTSAHVGMIHGQAALHQLLLWTDARFDFHHEDVVRRHQIPLTPDELFADAERFLAGVRESSGGLSPAMVLAQDVARVQAYGKQIPTEVYGVLRMFDGHHTVADVIEDSAYRVFETLRVAQRAVEAGLLRVVMQAPRRATWRALLAIEDWLLGTPPRDGMSGPREPAPVPVAAASAGAAPASAPAHRPETQSKPGRKRRKKKRRADTPLAVPVPAVAVAPAAPVAAAVLPAIDWGALIPRVVGAEVGPLAGVIPASGVSGEIVGRATRAPVDEPRPPVSEVIIEPSVVFDDGAEGAAADEVRAAARAAAEAARVETARAVIEAARAEAARAEAARAEAARVEAARAEEERIARAEAERAARAEAERAAAARAAIEAARVEAAGIEAERIARVEAERAAAEAARVRAARAATEARTDARRTELERAVLEAAHGEADRIARVEAERTAAEAQRAARTDAVRAAAEAGRRGAVRAAAEAARVETERAARAEAERAEAERAAAARAEGERAAAARVEAERAAAERAAAEAARVEAERAAAERAEAERAARGEAERAAAERAEAERVAAEAARM